MSGPSKHKKSSGSTPQCGGVKRVFDPEILKRFEKLSVRTGGDNRLGKIGSEGGGTKDKELTASSALQPDPLSGDLGIGESQH